MYKVLSICRAVYVQPEVTRSKIFVYFGSILYLPVLWMAVVVNSKVKIKELLRLSL